MELYNNMTQGDLFCNKSHCKKKKHLENIHNAPTTTRRAASKKEETVGTTLDTQLQLYGCC